MPASSGVLPSMSTLSSLSGDGKNNMTLRDFSIHPPSTGGDDGSPSNSLRNDVERVLELIQDERHLVAYKLYENVKERIQTPLPPPPASPKRLALHRHKIKREQKAARDAEEKKLAAAKTLFDSKKDQFEKLEVVARLFQKAHDEMSEQGDWIFSQTMFEVDTFYRREQDGSLSIKLEGNINGVPLFEQVAVLREVDLHYKWAPFCSSSLTIKQLDKIDVVGWFVVGLPNFGLMRDGCFRAIGCDSIHEDGTILLVGQGVADRDEDDREEDERYLSDDPVLQELDIPAVPTRVGGGRMTIQKFQAVIEILSPTSAKTKLIANINPNLDFVPQSLIDFLMKKLCGVLVSRLQGAAAKCAKEPVKNPHARRMREEEDFYRGWLKPKFEDYCKEMGWSMPPVAALELTQEQERESQTYERKKAMKRSRRNNLASSSLEDVMDPTNATVRSEPLPHEEENDDDDDETEVSDLSTTSSLWQNNPISGYLRELERKAQERKADDIAKARERAANRLKKSPLSLEQDERLKELKKVKARRHHHHQQRQSMILIQNKKNQFLQWTDNLHQHGKLAKVTLPTALFALMMFLLYGTNISVSLSKEANHWCSGLLRDGGTVVYLILCAAIHFILCDVALTYAFESFELGSKTGRKTKLYYSEMIRLGMACVSFGIIGLTTAKGLAGSWTAELVWRTIQAKRFLGSIVAPIVFTNSTNSNMTLMVAKNASEMIANVQASQGVVAGINSALSLTVWAAVTAMRSIMAYANNLFVRSHFVGRLSQDGLVALLRIPVWVITTWKEFVADVVATREGTMEGEPWRAGAIINSRFLLLHSAVFLLTVLLLFSVSATRTERNEDSSAASVSSSRRQPNPVRSPSRRTYRSMPSSPGGGSNLQEEVIHENHEYQEDELPSVSHHAPSTSMDDTVSQVTGSTSRSKKKFRIKKLKFRKRKVSNNNNSKADEQLRELREGAVSI